MKNGVIAANKSTWRSKLDLDYLNEKSEVKHHQQMRRGQQIGAKLQQFTRYASKEFTGSVHAAGFLHDRVATNSDGTTTPPAHLTNAERQKRIIRAWKQILKGPCLGRGAKKDVIQHRLVFSMSEELHRACLKAQINPDRVLHSMMKHSLRKFAEKFHPGDRIGYAYGFHHDTDNLHIHIALCPRTAKGYYVGYSQPKYRNNKSQHRDQYSHIQHCFQLENQKWGEILSSPRKLRELQRKDHRFCLAPAFQPVRHPVQQCNRPSQAEQLRHQHAVLVHLHNHINNLLRERDQRRLIKRATSAWRRGLVPLPKTIALATSLATAKARQSSLRQLRAQYWDLRRQYISDLSRFLSKKHTYGTSETIQSIVPHIRNGIRP
jgi:hypothetical protein